MSEYDEIKQREELYKLMCKRMRKLRKSLGLTQEAVSEKAGISLHYYGMIERGYKRGNIFTLKRIAGVLGVSLDYLISGEEEVVELSRLKDMMESMQDPAEQQVLQRVLVAMQTPKEYDAGDPPASEE